MNQSPHQYSGPATANSAGLGLPVTKHVFRGTLTSSEPTGAGKVTDKAMVRTVRKCQKSTGAASEDHNFGVVTFVLLHKKRHKVFFI